MVNRFLNDAEMPCLSVSIDNQTNGHNIVDIHWSATNPMEIQLVGGRGCCIYVPLADVQRLKVALDAIAQDAQKEAI